MSPLRAPLSRLAWAGFTLLEVLVALVVVATALAAGLGAIARTAEQGSEIQKRTMALWVAHNVYAEARVKAYASGNPPATGGNDGDAEMGPFKFRWHTETSAPNNALIKLRRMDITVTEATDLTPVRAGATAALVDKPYAWAKVAAFFADPS